MNHKTSLYPPLRPLLGSYPSGRIPQYEAVPLPIRSPTLFHDMMTVIWLDIRDGLSSYISHRQFILIKSRDSKIDRRCRSVYPSSYHFSLPGSSTEYHYIGPKPTDAELDNFGIRTCNQYVTKSQFLITEGHIYSFDLLVFIFCIQNQAPLLPHVQYHLSPWRLQDVAMSQDAPQAASYLLEESARILLHNFFGWARLTEDLPTPLTSRSSVSIPQLQRALRPIRDDSEAQRSWISTTLAY